MARFAVKSICDGALSSPWYAVLPSALTVTYDRELVTLTRRKTPLPGIWPAIGPPADGTTLGVVDAGAVGDALVSVFASTGVPVRSVLNNDTSAMTNAIPATTAMAAVQLGPVRAGIAMTSCSKISRVAGASSST